MPHDASPLPLDEQLLLAQLVCQSGSNGPDWAALSAALNAHPSRSEHQDEGLSAPTSVSAEACERAWTAALPTQKQTDSSFARRSAVQLGVAQQLYATRLETLLQQLQEKEQAYQYVHTTDRSTLERQIEKLESGALDAELAKSLPPPQDESPSAPKTVETRVDETTEAEAGPASDRADVDDDRQVEQDLLGDMVEPSLDEARSTERTPHATQATYRGRTRRSRSRAARDGPSSHSPTPPSSPPLSASLSRSVSSRPGEAEGEESVSDTDRDKSRRRTAQLLLMLYNQVSNHTHANLFHQAIKEVDAPDYYTLIKQPMDLKLIKQRIKDGQIASPLDLRWALSLMFANSLMYNQPGTEVHRMANEMRMSTDEILDEFDRTPRGA
ncbi:hypothetical protein MNAN1_003186 [Malassezia nana]|uniref:Bromo domain-containing protein n=1 Tax=Malassezia nana TaxID=180528 RepID=A0AAF0J8M4_9BASI|nr:hypothetical protein MNAN1_003186 [Malassezia nana]